MSGRCREAREQQEAVCWNDVVQLIEIKEADGEQVYGKDVDGNFVVA